MGIRSESHYIIGYGKLEVEMEGSLLIKDNVHEGLGVIGELVQEDLHHLTGPLDGDLNRRHTTYRRKEGCPCLKNGE